MATTKSKKTTRSSKSRATAARTKKAAVVQTPVVEKSGNPLKGFFARKFDANENILTIFKSPRIYGAILGEVLGSLYFFF